MKNMIYYIGTFVTNIHVKLLIRHCMITIKRHHSAQFPYGSIQEGRAMEVVIIRRGSPFITKVLIRNHGKYLWNTLPKEVTTASHLTRQIKILRILSIDNVFFLYICICYFHTNYLNISDQVTIIFNSICVLK